MRCRLLRDWSSIDYRMLLIRDERPNVHVANGFTWDTRQEGFMFSGTEGIERASATVQAILDAAWAEGFRPRGFADVQNETAAIRYHLEDMRAITFGKLRLPCSRA